MIERFKVMESTVESIRSIADLKKTCHACLCTETDIEDLTESTSSYERFSNIYKDCTSLELNKFGTFSLCQSCAVRIQDFHAFRAMCLDSHAAIEAVLNKSDQIIMNNNNEEIQTVEIPITAIEEHNERAPNLQNIEKPHVFKCINCDQSFEDISALCKHDAVEHGSKDYRCGICQLTVSQPLLLAHHMKGHKYESETGDVKIFSCGRCDKSYTTMVNLQIHMYSHLGIRPYKCHYCPKAFTKSATLKSHLDVVHTGARNFLCSECGKKFSTALLLKRHQTTHGGKRPFQCELCPSSFTVARDLTVHMRIHTGERPYLCSTCGKSFTRISHLNSHLRTHTGEKPYVCSFCSKGFAQSGDWKAHERIHTGEKPYSCRFCEKRFNQSSALKGHMKRHCTSGLVKEEEGIVEEEEGIVIKSEVVID